MYMYTLIQCTYVTDGRPAEVESCEHAQSIKYTIDNKVACHSTGGIKLYKGTGIPEQASPLKFHVTIITHAQLL